MFYAKQFKNLLDKVKELDPDAEVVPRLLRINFNLPIVGKCRLEYVHRGFDNEYDALGTMKLYYGDNMTEFDSLRYTIDGLEGLDRAIKRNTEPSPVNKSVEEIDDFTTMSADDLSGDVVSYLYDNYKDAAFIGEKSLPDGSIVLRFDWNGVDKDAVAKDLKDRYGDRIGFGSGHLQYAPEIKFDTIKVLPANDAVAVTESADNTNGNASEITEEGVKNVISKLGMVISNTWYDGNTSRPVYDCQFVDGPTICVWTEPPYEAKLWIKDANPRYNQFTEDIVTLSDLEQKLRNLIGDNSPTDEQLNAAAEKISAPDYHAEGAYEDLTDIGGDFEAVEFYKDVKTVCDIAGKPALAEAVIKLHKAYHPVMEAEGVEVQIFADYLEKKGITEIDAGQLERILNDMVYEKRITSCEADKIWTTIMNKAQPNMEAAEKAHKVPRDIAVAFNDYVADTLYTRPETHDQLKASEFEFNWDWLDDEAEDVIRVWNATHDPSALYRLLNDADENLACMHDGI